MKNVLRVMFVVSFAALLGISIIAQQAIAPPPRPAEQEAHAAATPKVKISAGVAVGMVLQRTAPLYPTDAMAARISGTVVLQATISKTGSIKNLRVISGPDMLRKSALDAVKTWRYKPYLLANNPVEVETTINVIYKLGGGEPSATPAAGSQTTIPPPPMPAGDGPSLAVTMQFIQDKLSHLGVVNYAAYNHDNADGHDWITRFSIEDTQITADPATCRVSFHEKRITEGKVTSDADFWFNLGKLQDVIVMPREQLLKKANIAHGHPTRDARIDPPLFMLVARRSETTGWYFYIFDQDLANRIAKAMVHGIELCGGGNKSPF
jgi:TonB family protein